MTLRATCRRQAGSQHLCSPGPPCGHVWGGTMGGRQVHPTPQHQAHLRDTQQSPREQGEQQTGSHGVDLPPHHGLGTQELGRDRQDSGHAQSMSQEGAVERRLRREDGQGGVRPWAPPWLLWGRLQRGLGDSGDPPAASPRHGRCCPNHRPACSTLRPERQIQAVASPADSSTTIMDSGLFLVAGRQGPGLITLRGPGLREAITLPCAPWPPPVRAPRRCLVQEGAFACLFRCSNVPPGRSSESLP